MELINLPEDIISHLPIYHYSDLMAINLTCKQFTTIFSPLIEMWLDKIYSCVVTNLKPDMMYLVLLAVKSCIDNDISFPDQLILLAHPIPIIFNDNDVKVDLLIFPQADLRLFIDMINILFPDYDGWFSANGIIPPRGPDSYSYRFKKHVHNGSIELLFSEGILFGERFDEITYTIPLHTPIKEIHGAGKISFIDCLRQQFGYFDAVMSTVYEEI